MNTNKWRNEALRRKVGRATKEINQATSSSGAAVYSSPNTARLYLTLSDQEQTPSKSMQSTGEAETD